jgi:hypothetical protein
MWPVEILPFFFSACILWNSPRKTCYLLKIFQSFYFQYFVAGFSFKRDHNGTKFLLKIFLYIAPTCSSTSIKWIRSIHQHMEIKDNTDACKFNHNGPHRMVIGLEVTVPREDFLSRCEDSQRIKIRFHFHKSCPLVPKMSLPSILWVIVREV